MSISEESPPRQRIREILHAALDLPVEERRAFVASSLAGADLEDALGLLDEVANLGSFLGEPAQLAQPASFQPLVPAQIGSFRVERVLGFGSMGVVYLAHQEAPRRPVAIKVLRVDASTSASLRRFEHEGEILARLSHPGIAAVFEAGVTDLGAGPQPYLAMQYIDGLPITRYADEAGLGERERVELIVQVARAAAYAHDQGVLHRDLKPDNVLVTADGEPCVLDFGVAQSSRDDVERLTLTATGQIVGTLAYMAPEQARGAALDARADQFALGAILHELLTGELPFDVRGKLPHEALRVVASADWRPPTRLDSTLAGDLEAILFTVLAAEPVRRYANLAAFVDDLESWLDGRSVKARPPSAVESFLRIVRRYKTLSAAIMLGLVATGAALFWGATTFLDLRREESVSLLLADRQLVARLESEAAGLWPTSSATLPAFDSWLVHADDVYGRLPHHRAAVAELGRRASTTGSDALDALYREGQRLLESIEGLRKGAIVDVRARRAAAAAIFDATVTEYRDEWVTLASRVRADGRFPGLRLPPQEGLVPLGPDPASNLEEFAVWGTGTVPSRASGRFTPRPEHALVLVLVPGGDAWIGAQSTDPESRNFLGWLEPHEGPLFLVRLHPFLLSKYEMTQGQWSRAFGVNPSDKRAGEDMLGTPVTELHPVESVSWEQVQRHLPRLGLTLPTEAQWESAARGATRWAYLNGRGWRSLVGYASWNTHDPQLRPPGVQDDGFYCHMPVGSLLPNAFGLHDVIGNVWEFCLDTYKVDYHTLEHRPGDGLVQTDPDGDVSRRGSGWAEPPPSCYVYLRQYKLFDAGDAATGVRPARAIVLEDPGDS